VSNSELRSLTAVTCLEDEALFCLGRVNDCRELCHARFHASCTNGRLRASTQLHISAMAPHQNTF